MSRTVKIRIPVAIDPRGRWYAYGWSTGDNHGPRNHDELLEVTDSAQVGPSESLFWITAELPIPEIREVEAEIAP